MKNIALGAIFLCSIFASEALAAAEYELNEITIAPRRFRYVLTANSIPGAPVSGERFGLSCEGEGQVIFYKQRRKIPRFVDLDKTPMSIKLKLSGNTFLVPLLQGYQSSGERDNDVVVGQIPTNVDFLKSMRNADSLEVITQIETLNFQDTIKLVFLSSITNEFVNSCETVLVP